MRAVRIVFHLVMLGLLVMAVTGVFSPAKTGNFAQDNGSYIVPSIGVLALWVIGAIVLRIVRSFTRA